MDTPIGGQAVTLTAHAAALPSGSDARSADVA